MSRRLKITLPDGLAAQLDELAANTGEPVARLAGQMVRQGIAEAAPNEVRQPRGELAPVLPDAPNEDEPGQRAPWLEPYGGTGNGARGCGAESSRSTGATPQRSPS
jgi:CopG-like RHH_1 or ribbon-helix-helix domain, RHH_5